MKENRILVMNVDDTLSALEKEHASFTEETPEEVSERKLRVMHRICRDLDTMPKGSDEERYPVNTGAVEGMLSWAILETLNDILTLQREAMNAMNATLLRIEGKIGKSPC